MEKNRQFCGFIIDADLQSIFVSPILDVRMPSNSGIWMSWFHVLLPLAHALEWSDASVAFVRKYFCMLISLMTIQTDFSDKCFGIFHWTIDTIEWVMDTIVWSQKFDAVEVQLTFTTILSVFFTCWPACIWLETRLLGSTWPRARFGWTTVCLSFRLTCTSGI